MRRIVVPLLSIFTIISCSTQLTSGATTPIGIITDKPFSESTSIKFSATSSPTNQPASTAIQATVSSLAPGIYPVTYSKEGFHVRSTNGEEVAFIQSPSFGPGEASPDGRYLVITQPDVILINLYSGEMETYRDFLPGFYPSWSPDGDLIAYTSVEDGHDFASLFVLDLEGLDERRITHGKGFEEMPAWSPDGKSIVFASDAANRAIGSTEPYILNVTCIDNETCDEDSKRLEALPEDRSASLSSWSPGGDQLAYISTDGDGSSIYIYEFSSSTSYELISEVSQHSVVKWSPDGKWIGYSRKGEIDNSYQGFIYHLTAGEERVISSSDREEYFSTWITVQ